MTYKISKSPSPGIKKLVIIGSEACPHCREANEKAINKEQAGEIDYTYIKKETVREAIDFAKRETNDYTIRTIPVYIYDGVVTKDTSFLN